MDIRTGQTYDSPEAALAAGVPASDVAEVTHDAKGEPWPRFTPKLKFTKGSFKPIEGLVRAE